MPAKITCPLFELFGHFSKVLEGEEWLGRISLDLQRCLREVVFKGCYRN